MNEFTPYINCMGIQKIIHLFLYGAVHERARERRAAERGFCIDNLLVRIHVIIVKIRWIGIGRLVVRHLVACRRLTKARRCL